MLEKIDKRIAALESELAELKRQKIAILQAQLAEAQASLTGAAPSGRGAAPARGRRGKRKTTGWAAEAAPAKPAKTRGPKKRGRKPGKRLSDEQVLAAVSKVVAAAGKGGISGRKVSEATGIHYPRVVKLMDKHYKKTGQRKWSRYHAK